MRTPLLLVIGLFVGCATDPEPAAPAKVGPGKAQPAVVLATATVPDPVDAGVFVVRIRATASDDLDGLVLTARPEAGLMLAGTSPAPVDAALRRGDSRDWLVPVRLTAAAGRLSVLAKVRHLGRDEARVLVVDIPTPRQAAQSMPAPTDADSGILEPRPAVAPGAAPLRSVEGGEPLRLQPATTR